MDYLLTWSFPNLPYPHRQACSPYRTIGQNMQSVPLFCKQYFKAWCLIPLSFFNFYNQTILIPKIFIFIDDKIVTSASFWQNNRQWFLFVPFQIPRTPSIILYRSAQPQPSNIVTSRKSKIGNMCQRIRKRQFCKSSKLKCSKLNFQLPQ